jgi:RNA polymerase sigma-70 factor, ECF subfamily
VPNSILYRIASGDKTAVQDCLKTYGGLVWSLAKRMLPNQNDAEDAVQEIFIDVWKNAGRFDEKQSSETTFIAMLARRRLIDRLRKSNRQPNVDSLEDVTFELAKRTDLDIQTSIAANEAAEAVRDLRPEQQKVLYLSICQGLSHQEIADLTGMPIGTVKTHARRGLIEVREILLKRSGESGGTKEVSA